MKNNFNKGNLITEVCEGVEPPSYPESSASTNYLDISPFVSRARQIAPPLRQFLRSFNSSCPFHVPAFEDLNRIGLPGHQFALALAFPNLDSAQASR
jgi:hypothetical protein